MLIKSYLCDIKKNKNWVYKQSLTYIYESDIPQWMCVPTILIWNDADLWV